jgi:hypothetical protein
MDNAQTNLSISVFGCDKTATIHRVVTVILPQLESWSVRRIFGSFGTRIVECLRSVGVIFLLDKLNQFHDYGKRVATGYCRRPTPAK